MRYLGTEKVVCPACGVELDVPVYTNSQGVKKYGYHFCNQCGASLFYEARLISLSKSFVDWLTDKFCFSYCDNNGCDTCAFHRDNNGVKKSCDTLTGEERLSIIERIHSEERKEKLKL